VTSEARICIENADEVLYVVADPVAVAWLEKANPRSRTLHSLYEPGVDRAEAYAAMVDDIIDRIRSGAAVCAVFYGHPGVFVNPSHAAIERARAEGYEARMLPGISAEDCLFADLGIDPSESGCQSYEATDFLARACIIDTSAALILWQVGVLGNFTYAPAGDLSRVPLLVEYLERFYPPDHPVLRYEAALYPFVDPLIEEGRVADLATTALTPSSTIYIPPAVVRGLDPDVGSRLLASA
jgi:hypothetical protein